MARTYRTEAVVLRSFRLGEADRVLPRACGLYGLGTSAAERLRDLGFHGAISVAPGDLRAFWSAWNAGGQGSTLPAAWKRLRARQPELKRHAQAWAEKLALPGELAANLAHYCKND